MSGYHLPSLTASEVLARGAEHLIDLRKRAAVAADGRMLRGAVWIDPFKLRFGHPCLKLGPLVFYCVHGHEVSQFGTALARVQGCEAAYVLGGFEALVAAGADLVPWAEREG